MLLLISVFQYRVKMELKTLKDIDFKDYTTSRSRIRNKIKQEAIKWIKVIKEKIKVINELESKPQVPLQMVATKGLVEVLEGQIKIFKDFFNITDKEVNQK